MSVGAMRNAAAIVGVAAAAGGALDSRPAQAAQRVVILEHWTNFR
jgi:hypothetical protein